MKTCALDLLPASVLTKCLQRLLPVITDIVNRSLDEALMPNSLKTALIIPLLKKTNLDTEDFKNFRPVTNLPFVSKLIEKSVAVQLVKYIDDNNFDEKLQSAYKKLHSTETALLRVHDDILRTVDVAVLLFYYCSIFLRHLTRSTMVYYFTDLILGLVSKARFLLGLSLISQTEVNLLA